MFRSVLNVSDKVITYLRRHIKS